MISFRWILQLTKLRAIISLIILFFSLAFLYYTIGIDRFHDLVQKISLEVIVLFLMVFTLNFLLRGLRWKFLLGNEARPYSVLLGSMLVGFFLNAVLPWRVGEAVRLKYLKEEQVEYGRTVSSVATEHLLDLSALLGIIGITSFLFLSETNAISSISWLLFWGFVVLFLLVFFLIVIMKKDLTVPSALQGYFPSFFRFMSIQYRSFKDGSSQILEEKHLIFYAAVLSMILWLSEGALFCLILNDLGVNSEIYLILLAALIGFLMDAFPISPGSYGTREIASASVLALAGVPFHLGLAASLFDHLIRTIYLCAIGPLSYGALKFRKRSDSV